MKGVIIVGSRSEEGQLSLIISELKKSAADELILVNKFRSQNFSKSDAATQSTSSDAEVKTIFVEDDGSNLCSAIRQAVRQSTSQHLVLIDAQSISSGNNWDEILSSIPRNSDLVWFAHNQGENSAELSEISSKAILELITSNSEFPAAIVAFRRDAAESLSAIEGDSTSEIIAKFIAVSISNIERVEEATAGVAANLSQLKFSNSARASLIKTLVNSSNIEELFPTLPWSNFDIESASAAYHSLAAQLIRLNDSDAALEILQLSDRLEDSPRSLALKGIIAMQRGETLGAVAHMVSSLQGYEIRKKENETHLAKFNPENLDQVNKMLQEGLSALNKRDNNRAASIFTEAVFLFDPFYNQMGLVK
jgi:hypothetical protein